MIFAALVGLACPACSSSSSNKSATDMSAAPSPLILARPYEYDIPAGSDPTKPLPLIVLLHGYGASGLLEDALFAFAELADQRQVYVAHPDGTIDSSGSRFWNATDACCNFDNSSVDDVAYLNAVVDDMAAHFAIDLKHVFFVGHSNGAFMSHRMGCDSAGKIAAIAAFAGDNWKDGSKCNPSVPVAALQIHGDADTEVPYDGDGMLMPSAIDSIGVWATKNDCTGGLQDTGKTYDFDSRLAGNETSGTAWSCPVGAAELWTMHGGMHVPTFVIPNWGNQIFDWLMAHPKS